MLVVEVPRRRAPERRWIVGTLLGRFLGLEHRIAAGSRRDTRISHGGNELTIPDGLLGLPDERWLRPSSLPRLPLEMIPGEDLPAIYGAPAASAGSLGFDLFGSAFFLMSRYEERVVRDRDEHGRFPAHASLVTRAGLLERPLVDEYVELLWHALAARWPQLSPPASRYELVPSHDVDRPFEVAGLHPREVVREAAGDLVRRRPRRAIERLARLGRSALDPGFRDPADTFDELMECSERLELRSTFHFLAHDPPGGIDGRFPIARPAARALATRIHRRGHTIGLHPSYASADDPERIREERARLEAALRGEGIELPRLPSRQHYLRFTCPETWHHHERAGIDLDATLGYADRAGFRAGTCRRFEPWSLTERRPLNLVEEPLVAMDATLFRYMSLDAAAARALVVRLADACRRVRGRMTLLWHNGALATPEGLTFYRELLDAIRP